MKEIELLKQKFLNNLKETTEELQKLSQQRESLIKEKEQLTGAIYALDTLSGMMVSSVKENKESSNGEEKTT
jgi:hypothetical protein